MPEDPAAVNRLNAIGVLTRREIEARILAPVIDALGDAFGRDRVVAIVAEVIRGIARQQGDAMATAHGDRSLATFAHTLEPWTRDDAMRIEVREASDRTLAFDVTRCRFAEMYRALGIPELGAVLSCNRDAALIEGFAPEITLTRTQTIMQGASCCDFRYARDVTPGNIGPTGANVMATLKDTARRFFDACESGKGWEGCKAFCHAEASFTAQADALADVKTLEGYTDWMKGLFTPVPDGRYELRTLAVDEERQHAAAYGIFRGTHTAAGGPVPPTGRRVEADYVYVMEFDGDRIRHMTKIWNDGFSLKQLGWA